MLLKIDLDRILKSIFISQLRDRMSNARRNGKTASLLNNLVRPSCLIIDEIGHCEFDKEIQCSTVLTNGRLYLCTDSN